MHRAPSLSLFLLLTIVCAGWGVRPRPVAHRPNQRSVINGSSASRFGERGNSKEERTKDSTKSQSHPAGGATDRQCSPHWGDADVCVSNSRVAAQQSARTLVLSLSPKTDDALTDDVLVPSPTHASTKHRRSAGSRKGGNHGGPRLAVRPPHHHLLAAGKGENGRGCSAGGG